MAVTNARGTPRICRSIAFRPTFPGAFGAPALHFEAISALRAGEVAPKQSLIPPSLWVTDKTSEGAPTRGRPLPVFNEAVSEKQPEWRDYRHIIWSVAFAQFCSDISCEPSALGQDSE